VILNIKILSNLATFLFGRIKIRYYLYVNNTLIK